MMIKKYIVSDMKEALIRAKYELGSEAIIVSHRPVRPGKWYNFLRKKELEVTVAVDRDSTEQKNPKEDVKREIWSSNTSSNISVEDSTMIEDIGDPFFKNSSKRIKERMLSYCRLHGKEDYSLTMEEKKDFFKIVLKETAFDKKVHLTRINVLVGPTGVGKTTTIAKLAAQEYLLNKKKVGLITIDTYRIGAVEQLRTYANILGIPFEIVNEPNEMNEKLDLLRGCDVIFVDTLGTSPKDIKKMEEVKNHLQAIEAKVNTYLVFSLSTEKDTMIHILERYKSMKYDALIVTKLDEVSNLSNLWYLIENSSCPVQFICNGQDVPDDIKLATLDNIFEYCEENSL